MLDKLEKVKIFIIGLFLIFHIIAYYLTKGGSLFKEDLKITCGKADIMTFLMWLQKKNLYKKLILLSYRSKIYVLFSVVITCR